MNLGDKPFSNLTICPSPNLVCFISQTFLELFCSFPSPLLPSRKTISPPAKTSAVAHLSAPALTFPKSVLRGAALVSKTARPDVLVWKLHVLGSPVQLRRSRGGPCQPQLRPALLGSPDTTPGPPSSPGEAGTRHILLATCLVRGWASWHLSSWPHQTHEGSALPHQV